MGNPYADLSPSDPTPAGPAWGEEPYPHDDPLYRQRDHGTNEPDDRGDDA